MRAAWVHSNMSSPMKNMCKWPSKACYMCSHLCWHDGHDIGNEISGQALTCCLCRHVAALSCWQHESAATVMQLSESVPKLAEDNLELYCSKHKNKLNQSSRGVSPVAALLCIIWEACTGVAALGGDSHWRFGRCNSCSAHYPWRRDENPHHDGPCR